MHEYEQGGTLQDEVVADPESIRQAQSLAQRTRELCRELPFDDDTASFLSTLEELVDDGECSGE